MMKNINKIEDVISLMLATAITSTIIIVFLNLLFRFPVLSMILFLIAYFMYRKKHG